MFVEVSSDPFLPYSSLLLRESVMFVKMHVFCLYALKTLSFPFSPFAGLTEPEMRPDKANLCLEPKCSQIFVMYIVAFRLIVSILAMMFYGLRVFL